MVKVNGMALKHEKGQSVEEFLAGQGFTLARIAVERNGMILPKAEYGGTPVEDDDTFEVVSFVGGG